MRRKKLATALVVPFILFGFIGAAQAFTLLTKKQALIAVFGTKNKLVVQSKVLEGDVLAKILSRLEGRLVYEQIGSESAKVSEQHEVKFYLGKNAEDKVVGVAIIDVQPGKWGPIEFIVAMNPEGVVKAVKVMSYQEKRGRPIAQKSFMRQYKDKTSKSDLEVGKDITGISGATISSRCATYTVKKAIVLYEELYLNK